MFLTLFTGDPLIWSEARNWASPSRQWQLHPLCHHNCYQKQTSPDLINQVEYE